MNPKLLGSYQRPRTREELLKELDQNHEYRRKLTVRLAQTQDFKRDIVEGKITNETLAELGLKAVIKDPTTITVDLIEL